MKEHIENWLGTVFGGIFLLLAVIVTVEDQGPGIPDNRLEAVFDRFYSERPEGERFGTHSGLGLSIARDIARSHGGDITLDDSPMGGLRAIIRVPA